MAGNRVGPSPPRGGATSVQNPSQERDAQGGGTATPARRQRAPDEGLAGLPRRSAGPPTATPSGASVPAGTRLYQHLRATNSDVQGLIGGNRRAAERAMAHLAPVNTRAGRAGQPPHPLGAAGQAPAGNLPIPSQRGRAQRAQDSQRQSQLGALREGALDALGRMHSQLQPPSHGRTGRAQDPPEGHGPGSAAGFGSIFPPNPAAQAPAGHAEQPPATAHGNPLFDDPNPPMLMNAVHDNPAFEPATTSENPLVHDRDPQVMPGGTMHRNPAFEAE
jgi:hypothetical protein